MNCMRWLSGILLTLLIASSGYATVNGKLTGIVTDLQSQNPIVQATVNLLNTGNTQATDEAGSFSFQQLSPGVYTLSIEADGYGTTTYYNIQLFAGKTQALEFMLSADSDQETIILTRSSQVFTTAPPLQGEFIRLDDQIRYLPHEDYRDILPLAPGTVYGHIRGGKINASGFFIDGVALGDWISSRNRINLPQSAYAQVTSQPIPDIEYPYVPSGFRQLITQSCTGEYHGNVEYRSSTLGEGNSILDERDRLQDGELSFGGPIPKLEKFGTFYVAGQNYLTRGRFDNDDSTNTSAFGKLILTPLRDVRLNISGGSSNSYFSHFDNQWEHDAPVDVYGDGSLIRMERMLDHLPTWETHAWYWNAQLDHHLSPDLSYHLQVARTRSETKYNIREDTNEDSNQDGIFDLEPRYSAISDIPEDFLSENAEYLAAWPSSADPQFYYFDFNRNGAWDYEDRNGNGVWDWAVYGSSTDLFTDNNNNGYIDASEHGPESEWMAWEDVYYDHERNDNGDFTYGDGWVYDYNLWGVQITETTSLKGHLDYRMKPNTTIQVGLDADFYEIIDHTIARMGGGMGQTHTKFTPTRYGAWIKGRTDIWQLVLTGGVRADLFEPDEIKDYEFAMEQDDPKSQFMASPMLSITWQPFTVTQVSLTGSMISQIPDNWYFYPSSIDDTDPDRTSELVLEIRQQIPSFGYTGITGFLKWVDPAQRFSYQTGYIGYTFYMPEYDIRGMEITLCYDANSFVQGEIRYTPMRVQMNYDYDLYLRGEYWEDHYDLSEVSADWDQATTLTGTLLLTIPREADLTPWKCFNRAIEELSLSTVVRYGSGIPYATSYFNNTLVRPPDRLESTTTVDARLMKRFTFANRNAVYAYVQAFNLFDQRNIDQLYFQENADPVYYSTNDSDGDGSPDFDVDGYYNDPRFWQAGRRWQVGIGFDF